ncbi:hypothetical protein HAP94_25880 [Acidithiobacillus ferrivorans]|nr:hypothetical protein [Acidithiobacillus ferrivorans]
MHSSKNDRRIHIDYPDDYPIHGALQGAFSRLIMGIFEEEWAWSSSSLKASFPERLFNLRQEIIRLQAFSIPTVLPNPHYPADGPQECFKNLVTPAERVAWGNSPGMPLEDMPEDMRQSALAMANRLLGVHIWFGQNHETNHLRHVRRHLTRKGLSENTINQELCRCRLPFSQTQQAESVSTPSQCLLHPCPPLRHLKKTASTPFAVRWKLFFSPCMRTLVFQQKCSSNGRRTKADGNYAPHCRPDITKHLH